MKSLFLLAALSGGLALACANAKAATESASASFRVSLRITAPCAVSTRRTTPGREQIAVDCASPYTPYRLETGARGLESQPSEARADEDDGNARMTLTF